MRYRCVWLIVLAFAAFAACTAPVSADTGTATILRVFLNDGTAIASYGEYSRVADRVVFSMPLGDGFHVVNIPAAAVDWPATTGYADAARKAQYAAGSAEADYAALTGEVASVLNAVVLASDPQARLRMAMDVRRRLEAWPRDHYGYRANDVRDVITILDEVVSSLRAAAGETTFEFNLVAEAAGSPVPESAGVRLLPPPTPSDTIAQALALAKVTDTAGDRVSLLKTVVSVIDDPRSGVDAAMAKASRKSALRSIGVERQVEQQYASIGASSLKRAAAAAGRADVGRVQDIVGAIRRKDAELGHRRPDEVNALIAQVQRHLDSARALRLARDRWQERVGSYRAYLGLIAPASDVLTGSRADLDRIKSLAGIDSVQLAEMAQRFGDASRALRQVTVPDELKAAHAMLVSALTLADNAVRTRREAIVSGNIRLAWDASSAAAGARALFARAQEDMQLVVTLPQIR